MREIRVYYVQQPMRIGFGHAAATRTTSESVVLELDLLGCVGLGECAPRSYVTGETCATVCDALKSLPLARIVDRLLSESPNYVLYRIKQQGIETAFDFTAANNVVCVVELAILDWIGKRTRVSLDAMLRNCASPAESSAPIKISQVLDQNLTVGDFLRERGPFHFVKIKAHRDRAKDLETVTEIRKAIGGDTPIVIDANMSWSLVEAVEHVRRLREAGLTMVEEPFAKRSWTELRELRVRTGISVMLDESISTSDDLRRASGSDSCDAVNVRVSKCGGLLRSIEMIKLAKNFGIQFQIGVQVAECGPLIQAGRLLASLHRDAIAVEGGQADRFFDSMIVSPELSFDRARSMVPPPAGFGLGLSTSTEISKYLAFDYSRAADKWAATSHYTEA
ncbi:enolase C-terminal domain-like protein [Burkholderia lata]|uniref:enolase C-terminal domain-like protein n=1 Tax=Burkholderia lata (strain ATCC 17760 / DSM 23089 / LMG 22485 / NCIMB 9086 / R18194 / 383) TaxID=482957 RepID=UPI001452EB62|nr:enolase C-terminal domain-like protein [Burkholderia lata]VWM12878.1 putative mandelate racemase/muconate lactonizing enzyme [Burkholderia lata]